MGCPTFSKEFSIHCRNTNVQVNRGLIITYPDKIILTGSRALQGVFVAIT